MSLQLIVQTLGGDLYDRGRRANIPAPGHSAADRSVSLLLENNRIVVHTFGDGDWRAVLDHLRAHKLIDAGNAPLSIAGEAEVAARAASVPAAGPERLAAARRLWDDGRSLGRSLGMQHCRLRGVTRDLPGPEALRFGPATPVSAYRPGRHVRPALLAGIQDAGGALSAVEVTYLAPSGRRASDLKLSRKTVGLAPGGCAVRLDVVETEMLVAEGVFSALSASEWFGLPAWALMSTRNLRVWSPPEGVRSVLVAADRGADGEGSAERLKGRLIRDGVAASIALPPEPFGDWNEWSEAQKRQDRARAASAPAGPSAEAPAG